MTEPRLTGTRIAEGVWHAALAWNGDAPDLLVTHAGEPVQGLEVRRAADGTWDLRLPLPVERIADGVQTFLVEETGTGQLVGRVVLVAGEALDDDLRAEIALLRAELDLLKKAFRRHCREIGRT